MTINIEDMNSKLDSCFICKKKLNFNFRFNHTVDLIPEINYLNNNGSIPFKSIILIFTNPMFIDLYYIPDYQHISLNYCSNNCLNHKKKLDIINAMFSKNITLILIADQSYFQKYLINPNLCNINELISNINDLLKLFNLNIKNINKSNKYFIEDDEDDLTFCNIT